MRKLTERAIVSSLFCIAALSCGGEDQEPGGSLETGGKGGKGGSIGVGGSGTISVGGSGGSGTGGSATGGGPYMLPDDFTEGTFGGYKLGEPVTGDNEPDLGTGNGMGCGAQILGIVRDFKDGLQDDGHPDFQTYNGSGEQGIVEPRLGDDQKPVHAAGDHELTTTEEAFNQWYVTVPGVNEPFYVFFYLQPNNGTLTFFSDMFFPLDGEGFGNQGHSHNYHFTTEVHTTFQYMGGETFRFNGDDDLWVFINGELAIDLGGLHGPLSREISLDAEAGNLGITPGTIYPLDLFHAERHTSQSNFRIDTNLAFVDCGVIVDDPVR
jgi:fibro-slime domain-containing protein